MHGDEEQSREASPLDRTKCCVVSVETLPAQRHLAPHRGRKKLSTNSDVERGNAAQASDGTAFKVLSFFVGAAAAGSGRLHQQSIIMDLP